MNIKKATKRYEAWLAERTEIVEADLQLKHERMAEALFPFMRATFYRWIQVWPEVCKDLANAPGVLAVGDLHVANFGTWRDLEGRLVWGINDFDEAYELPYTNDLVRLAASAHLSIEAGHVAIAPADACGAILAGYAEGLETGGGPFVLAEQHKWLREIALSKQRDPIRFWQKMDGLPATDAPLPISAKEALESLLPEEGLAYRVVRRVAGLGSLGHQRLVALADWRGGRLAREAKALVPSACQWAHDDETSESPGEIMYQAIISGAVRCLDPCVQLRGQWIVRRLAPDCCRIELADLPEDRDETRLLRAMGRETANVHLGSKEQVRAIIQDLMKRPGGWLHLAAKDMVKTMADDWKDWKDTSTA